MEYGTVGGGAFGVGGAERAVVSERPFDLAAGVPVDLRPQRGQRLGEVENDQLAHPQTRGVEQLEQRPVAPRQRIFAVGRLEQLFDLSRPQVPRQVLRLVLEGAELPDGVL